MSRFDLLFCERIARLTRRKTLSPGAKAKIQSLVRAPAFTETWKPAWRSLVTSRN